MSDLHDPLPRQHDGEPRFVLLARDPLSDGLVALWAALRARRIWAVAAIVKNLVVACGELPYRPDADPEHVQSAHQISNAMRMWRTFHMPKVPKNERDVEIGTDAGDES